MSKTITKPETAPVGVDIAEEKVFVTSQCVGIGDEWGSRKQHRCRRPATHEVVRHPATPGGENTTEFVCKEHIGPAFTYETFSEIEA